MESVLLLDGVLETIFWLCAAGVLYTYVGYPLLLLLVARLRPAPAIQKAEIVPRVSLILVVCNEEGHLEAKLDNCLALDYPEDRLEILVVSDGSRDRTEEIARRFASRGVRLLRLAGPRGKAAALNRAVYETGGEVLVLTDARQLFARDAIRHLVSNLADPTVGAVSGELHLKVPPGSAAGEGVGAYWRYEKLLRRTESRIDSTVGVTGAIYAVRRDLFPDLDPRTILDDVAVPLEIVRAGYRVVFEPQARAVDTLPERPGQEYRRKVRTLTGNYQLVFMCPELLLPRWNRLFWQFVSHKLARLAMPWCLAALCLTSLWLAGRGSKLYGLAFAAQAVFYGLAWGRSKARRSGPRRLLSVPYAFTLLHLAAASALFGFLLKSQRASWKAVRP